jgi:hypothetical protein
MAIRAPPNSTTVLSWGGGRSAGSVSAAKVGKNMPSMSDCIMRPPPPWAICTVA